MPAPAGRLPFRVTSSAERQPSCPAMIAILLTAALATPVAATDTAGTGLSCDLGPAAERIGGNDWLVYGCGDGASVVVVAGPPNPASPFYFFVTPKNGGIDVYGEGTGPRTETDPAYAQLRAMTADDVGRLHRKAVAAGAPKAAP